MICVGMQNVLQEQAADDGAGELARADEAELERGWRFEFRS